MLPLLALGLAGAGLKNLTDKVNEDRAPARRAAADGAERRSAVADVEPAIKEAGDGMGPSAVMVGKAAYGTEKEADVAAKAYNAPEAKIARLQGVMLNQADPGGAMALEKTSTDMQDFRSRRAKALEAEGISQFVDDNLGAAPDVAWVKSNPGATFDLANVDQFNKMGGRITIPAGSKGRWKTMDMGDGRELVDFEVIDPTGKTYPSAQSARTLQWLQQMGAAGVEKEAAARHKTGQEAQFKRDELTSLDNYRKGMVEASQTRADKTGSGGSGSGSAFERMNQYDLKEFEALSSQIKEIQSGIVRGTIDQTWAPESNPSQQAMLLQKRKLENQAKTLLSKYGEQSSAVSGQARPDRYNIRSEIEEQAPPTFDVRGDPASFRRQLVAKGSAAALEAFDKQYPQAGRPAPSKAEEKSPTPKAQSSNKSGVVDRIAATLGAILPKPNWDAQAQSVIASGDKNQMRMLLSGGDSQKGLSAEMKAKLSSALAR